MSAPVDVLAVMDADIRTFEVLLNMPELGISDPSNALRRSKAARAAVAELIEERERLRLVESCAHILAVHIAGHFALPTDNSKAICLDWSKKTRAALARIGAKP